MQRLLRHEPCQVLTASRGTEALELLANDAAQVVVTDQRMPEMNGVELLSVVRERHPDVVRMMLTGYTEMNVAVEAINRGEIYRLITKPWNDEELKATLRQAFDHYDLKSEIKRLNQVTREQNFKLQDMNRNLEAQGARPHQAARREAPGAAHRVHPDDPRARRGGRREGRLHARPLRARRRLRLEDRARDRAAARG